MSLIERSVAFAEAAKDLDGLRKAAKLIDGVRTRAGMFEGALAELRLARGRLALLRAHGVSVSVDVSSAAGFAHHLTQLRAAIAEDPSAVTATDVGQKTVASLRNFTTSLTEACKAAWQTHVFLRLPRVGADLLPVLAQVPALKARVEAFRTLQKTASSEADSVPSSEADIQAFERMADACHVAWDALDADAISADVKHFLRGATSAGGADLKSLTHEVCAWLETHGLSASFAIWAR